MQVLVTGASGFIGRVVVERLRVRGHSVVALVRNPRVAKTLSQQGIVPLVGDVRDRGLLAGTSADAVIHLASTPTEGSFRGSRRYAQVDIGGALNVARQLPAGAHFVYLSTAWVYGSGADWFTEGSPPRPHTWMAQVKARVEAVFQRRQRWTVFRAGMVYPGGGFDRQVTQPARRGWPICPGRGDNHAPLVHVADVASVLCGAVEREVLGVYNLVDDVPLPWAQMCSAVASAVGARRPLHVPLWMVRTLRGTDTARFVSADLRLSNRGLKGAGFTLQYPLLAASIEQDLATWSASPASPRSSTASWPRGPCWSRSPVLPVS